MHDGPSYLRVLLTFARNSLVRDMTFRANFLIDSVASLSWVSIQLAFYLLIFEYAPSIGLDWGKYQFLIFLATTLLANSLVGALFMPNLSEFSELIRTGSLDFALLKPIDTQFLISLAQDRMVVAGEFCVRACPVGGGAGAPRSSARAGPVGAVPHLRAVRRGATVFADDRAIEPERVAGTEPEPV